MSTKRTRLTAARQRLLERILAVAAVVAVLVAAGAWFAMSRPADADVTATGSTGAVDGSGSADYATGGGEDAAADAGEEAASDAPVDGQEGSEAGAEAEADAGSGTGQGSSGSASGGQGSGSGSGSGTAPSGGSGDGSTPFPDGGVTAPRTPAPTGPATAFLAALEASGLAPPTDAEHRLAFGRDVCDEMDLGSTYTDMVRALTFAGATDAQAENFVRLATTHLCPKHAR